MIWTLLIILLAAIGILWFIRKSGSRISEAERNKAKSTWRRVTELADSRDDHAWTKAIFEADKLLDWSLGLAGVRGGGLGEKLKNGRSMIRNIDAVWQAHKLRNQLAHDLDVRITHRDTQVALSAFETAIRNLGLL